MMPILKMEPVEDGVVVLRGNHQNTDGIGFKEYVTGVVFRKGIPSDDTEHTWGHYFKTYDEALKDYYDRIKRGY